jgi:long-chain acyl-CoA synthetase
MCAVPRFFENFRQRIVDNAQKETTLKRRLFELALSQGAKRSLGKFAPLSGITDKLVGSRIRSRTGGRMRFFVSGGAALSPQVTEFYSAFGLTILQGYGLTETTAATCLNRYEDNRPWTVGPPIEAVEVKTAEDGEILVRGTAVMKGYHRLPEATAEAIDAEGWFHTGDIGEFDGPNLKITDRKKDIIVLGNGKNVAPQKIEAKLVESEFVSEAVLFGDGMEYVCALIVPNFDRLRPWLLERGHHESDPTEAVALEDVKALFKEEVVRANKTLADFEKVKRHCLLGTVFSVETGELTPSLKVKRRFVREKYASELASLMRS